MGAFKTAACISRRQHAFLPGSVIQTRQKDAMAKYDLQGSLDLLVLKSLSQHDRLHGYGIVQHVGRASHALLRVEEGSLYPALHRMEQSGWIASEWGVTDTGRRAKYYTLLHPGRQRLQEAESDFEQLVKGIRAVMRYA